MSRTKRPTRSKTSEASGSDTDAMVCQREINQGILDRGANYLLSLKENQGQLYEDMRDLFEGTEEFVFEEAPHDYATTLNKDRGRIERRECWTISAPSCLAYLSTGQDWPGLRSVIKVVGAAGRRRKEPRYTPGITSAAWMPRRSACWRRCTLTGASRTPCTGAWT